MLCAQGGPVEAYVRTLAATYDHFGPQRRFHELTHD